MVYKKRLSLQLWQIALAYLEEGDHLQTLSYKIRATYSHLNSILKVWMNYNMVTVKKIGKKKIIKLTEKGKDIQQDCKNLIKKLDLQVGPGGWQNGSSI